VEIVEERLELSALEERYGNDETGLPAYDPKVLLKVVLYGYYKGILSSRQRGLRRVGETWCSGRSRLTRGRISRRWLGSAGAGP